MANTTWSSTDKLNITLSGTNSLTATTSGSGSAVRTIDRQVTGKYYWEYTCTTYTGNACVGVANAGAVLSTVNTASVGACGVYASSGNILLNNVASGSTLGARASGDIIGIALDLDNRLVWFRVAPAGNWNGSGTANPATGVGGIGFGSIGGGGIPLYGLFSSNASPHVVTANFGDSAFTGTVPSGFTSGFTAGATIATNALATQLAIEHWLTTNTPAQVTQVALEHWTSSLAAVVPPSGTDVRAIIMA